MKAVVMFKISKTKILFFSLLALFIIDQSCHTYYKVNKRASEISPHSVRNLDSLKQLNRYFILRSGENAWSMTGIVLSDDQKSLSCTLDSVSYLHQLHFTHGRKGKMAYGKANPDENQVINEVHLFIPSNESVASGTYKLELDKVQKIEVLEKDAKRTTNSYVLGAVGYTIGALIIVGIIVLATKSSCPFVSAYDGQDFSLQGEIYGGSIYPQLARHDYMPLKMAPLADGSLQVKISNELQERQFTDMAELWVLTHDSNLKMLADERGNPYSISSPQAPTSATLNGNSDVLSGIKSAHDNELVYMDDTSRIDARNEVLLKFKNNAASSHAKLVLSLKNSYWLDLLYGELAKGFGSYYMTYIKEQRNKPAADLLKWVQEQRLPLTVSLKTNSGWKEVSSITTIGPVATREMVVPLDLSEADNPQIEVKLSSGFMFWELDYAAIDFTKNSAFTLTKLSPKKATDENGADVLSPLSSEDGQYLEQPSIGNVATLIYGQPDVQKGKTQTYILHTKGYYEHIRNFTNKPDPGFLMQFKNPDAFPIFGMRRYQQVKAESLHTLAGNK